MYQLSKNWDTTAGPNHRAGFIAAPVKGPPIIMSIEIVSPIANPPTALKLPFGSIPVPYTTNTRRKVRIASTRIPTAGVTVHERPGGLPRAGVPRWDACQTEAGKMTLRPNAATRAPSSWDPQETAASRGGIGPPTGAPRVTAGVKCAP